MGKRDIRQHPTVPTGKNMRTWLCVLAREFVALTLCGDGLHLLDPLVGEGGANDRPVLHNVHRATEVVLGIRVRRHHLVTTVWTTTASAGTHSSQGERRGGDLKVQYLMP